MDLGLSTSGSEYGACQECQASPPIDAPLASNTHYLPGRPTICLPLPTCAPADDAAMPDDMAAGNETAIISYLRPNITVQMVDDFT